MADAVMPSWMCCVPQRVRDAESAAEQAGSAVQQCHRELDGAAPATLEAAQAELQSRLCSGLCSPGPHAWSQLIAIPGTISVPPGKTS